MSRLLQVLEFTCIALAVKNYVIDVSVTSGPSMLPTLSSFGDVILLQKWNLNGVSPGDVIVAKSPLEPDKTVCKRVLGVTGERVPIERIVHHPMNGLFNPPLAITIPPTVSSSFVNTGADNPSQSPSPSSTLTTSMSTSASSSLMSDSSISLYSPPSTQSRYLTIPPGHIWIEGDNPDQSCDSRHYGPLPVGLVTGKVICKLWPIVDFGKSINRSPF